MLINNKLKQWLCGESYGSNSERKSLPLRLKELDNETTRPIWKKKKHIYKTYSIGDELEVSIRRIGWSRDKQVKEIKEKLYWLNSNIFQCPILNVRILEKRTNKSGREEYNAEIIWARDEYEKEINGESILGMVVKIQSI